MKWFYALACILCGVGILSGQKKTDTTIVVAEFGKQRITLQEFRIAYLQILKNPKIFDSKELRNEFLDELIQRRILAKEAERRGLAKSEFLKNKVEAFHNKVLRVQHFDAVIKPKFEITEDEVEKSYMFTQESRKIKHLFYKTKDQAERAYSALRRGAAFDSLARICFTDSTLAGKGGDLGWVEWDQLEYDMAQTAFQQPVGMISEPIQSSFGYHLIEVTDFKKKPMLTRYEYEVHKRKVKYLVEYKLGDKYAFEYIHKMMSTVRLDYHPDVMEFVDTKLKDFFKRKPSSLDQTSEFQLTDNEIQKVELSLWNARNEVMAVVNGKNYTVGMFIGDLNYIPYDALYKSFRWTFDYALRDFLLTQEALKLGLEKNEQVRMKTNLFREYVLQQPLRREIVRDVTVDEAEIKTYYDTHQKECNGATLEQMREIIREYVVTEKKQKAIPDLVKKLMHGAVVKKNMNAIDDYYESVKKGDIR
jgi:parvulin-like peptidyl-prolyl isomerase